MKEFGQMTDHPAIDQMIMALDSAPRCDDGIDPRTWREVYDAKLITDDDVTYGYNIRGLDSGK